MLFRSLAAPLKTDAPIISGESGAAGFGAFATIMLEPEYYELKEKLGLNGSSRVLCFSTEGDTDPKRFRDIVWRGKER